MAVREGQQFRNITRREFLNYVWIASLALFLAGMRGAVYAFALPRFLEGDFGGKATIGTVAYPGQRGGSDHRRSDWRQDRSG